MGPTIRQMEARDAERVAELSDGLGYPASREQIAQRIEQIKGSSHDLLLVAELDGRVVGWLQAHHSSVIESGARVEIAGLIVDQDRRRGGVGQALLKAAESWAWGKGIPAVVVRTNVTRQESHSFYRALGYTETKVQQVYRKTRTL